MPQPLVSVICLCYQHADFVIEALESVRAQTYPAVELLVVDDASSDESVQRIRQWLEDKPEVKFFPLTKNMGNCRAFNQALRHAQGKYIIDLAADDVLLPERVAVGVAALEAAGPMAGVHFSDVLNIDATGKSLGTHYRRNKEGHLLESVPQGWIYTDLLRRYFVSTPSMLIRRELLDELGGYDEQLAYEDFDFWIRSAKRWQYVFTDAVLVKKRILPNSQSTHQYRRQSAQLRSTLRVCQKAFLQNDCLEEQAALDARLAIEFRQAVKHRRWWMAASFLAFKKRLKVRPAQNRFYTLVWMLGSRFLKP